MVDTRSTVTIHIDDGRSFEFSVDSQAVVSSLVQNVAMNGYTRTDTGVLEYYPPSRIVYICARGPHIRRKRRDILRRTRRINWLMVSAVLFFVIMSALILIVLHTAWPLFGQYDVVRTSV